MYFLGILILVFLWDKFFECLGNLERKPQKTKEIWDYIPSKSNSSR